MTTIIDEASAAALAPEGSLSDMELPEFPSLKITLDPGGEDTEPSVTATNADGEEVTPPTVDAVLGALRYTPGTAQAKLTTVTPPVLAVAPRYAGDENTVPGVGMTILKTGAMWADENSEPFPPGTVPIRTDWLYDDDSPAPGLHTDSDYLVDPRDVGKSIKVVETAQSGGTSESNALAVEAGESGSAPLVDDAGNLLPESEQPADAVLPPPPFVAVEEPTRQNMEAAEEPEAPVAAAAATEAPAAPTNSWPRTHAALDEIAAEVGLTFPPEATTIDAKIVALEAAGVKP